MNTRHVLTIIMVFAAVFFAVTGLILDSATAETVSIKGHNKDQVQGKCGGDGDVYWQGGPTYGCMKADGSGIVCGGTTPQQKNTCDTFARVPRHFRFPTREELAKAGEKR